MQRLWRMSGLVSLPLGIGNSRTLRLEHMLILRSHTALSPQRSLLCGLVCAKMRNLYRIALRVKIWGHLGERTRENRDTSIYGDR